ncbi:MAG: hypothetical protein QW290_04250 [Sulfolobales archaeon]
MKCELEDLTKVAKLIKENVDNGVSFGEIRKLVHCVLRGLESTYPSGTEILSRVVEEIASIFEYDKFLFNLEVGNSRIQIECESDVCKNNLKVLVKELLKPYEVFIALCLDSYVLPKSHEAVSVFIPVIVNSKNRSIEFLWEIKIPSGGYTALCEKISSSDGRSNYENLVKADLIVKLRNNIQSSR